MRVSKNASPLGGGRLVMGSEIFQSLLFCVGFLLVEMKIKPTS